MIKVQGLLLTGLIGLSGYTFVSSLAMVPAAIGQTACGRTAPLVSFETTRNWVYICKEEGNLVYIQREKSTQNFFQLPARRTDFGFAADSTDKTFFISSNSLQVRQDGRLVNYEPVLSTSQPNATK